jgi:phosphopantetheinyl transferase (holo-ACP synthase)
MHEPGVTHHLREFLGTKSAYATFLTPGTPLESNESLLAKLSFVRSHLEATPLRDRIFGEPELLKKDPTSPRVEEWNRSRAALLNSLEDLPIDAALRYSFSHSGGAALAIAASSDISGVGVDLERSDREISDAAFSRYFRKEEGAFLTDRLGHWILKEACFKANALSTNTLISDYFVVGFEKGVYFVECRKGPREQFRGILGSVAGYRYAIAAATR